MAPTLTRAARLDRLIQAVNPEAYAARLATPAATDAGLSGGVTRDPNPDGAPYVILTLPDGRRRIKVTTAHGDEIAGVGATIDDALAMLETKLAAQLAAVAEA